MRHIDEQLADQQLTVAVAVADIHSVSWWCREGGRLRLTGEMTAERTDSRTQDKREDLLKGDDFM